MAVGGAEGLGLEAQGCQAWAWAQGVLRSCGLKVRRAQVTLRRVGWLKSLEYPKTELKSGEVMRLLW